MKNGVGRSGEKFDLVYVCSLVADVHYTLFEGGIAMNPRCGLHGAKVKSNTAFCCMVQYGTVRTFERGRFYHFCARRQGALCCSTERYKFHPKRVIPCYVLRTIFYLNDKVLGTLYFFLEV